MIVAFYKAPLLDVPQISHGFFGRNGGVSKGIYESLNCGIGSSDEKDKVLENIRRVKAVIAAPQLQMLYQVHSATVISLNENLPERPQGDALVTDRPGLALGVLSADCAPVLFFGQKENGQAVIAAAHAGWRGAVSGVLENTIEQMSEIGALKETICAAVGPCILQKSYEVSKDFPQPVLEEDANAERFFKEGKSNKLYFDLEGYAAYRLARSGIGKISVSGLDTYVLEKDYFSYRRAQHRGEDGYGRQISTIMIRAGG